ncbi:MAG: hypothetical protein RMJ98_16965, partial [Myxococcales bacterium]|nr:hypothetical protein [Polyangiaceae bacterium]MDW8250988.1 hypothetical protein [Myxococcales bacterium]
PWFPREVVNWPPSPGFPTTTLAVGPSTIDLILPTAPLGLFLSSRRLQIGPRSRFVGAFTPSEVTHRLTAAVLIDD